MLVKPYTDETESKDEANKETTLDTLIHKLIAYNAALQVSHWRADTLSNEHRVLGELYEQMISLTDKFVEVYMGEYDVIEAQTVEIKPLSDTPVNDGCDLMEEMIKQLDQIEDGYIINILYEMQAVLYRAIYLLKE